MIEFWKDIENYEGLYQVSDQGRVRSLERSVERRGKGLLKIKGKIISSRPKDGEYCRLILHRDGVKSGRTVHKLVAEAFLDKPDCLERIAVDHINNIKTDNRLCNLQYITYRENNSKDKKEGSSKHTGVYIFKGKIKAQIKINNSSISLGIFDSEYLASEAYQMALKNTHLYNGDNNQFRKDIGVRALRKRKKKS